jgi:hypothetical protein
MRSALSGPAGADPGARAPSDPPNELVRPNTLTAAAAGAFAAVVLSSSAGLLAVSGAFVLSRANAGSGWAQLLFWLGLGLIMLPASARLTQSRSRGERVALVLLVGALLQIVTVLHDPYGFTYADEWVHEFNVQQILRTGSLFHANPIIPVTSRYPGLESVTAAFASLSHLSLFVSGIVVVAAARVVLLLALFLFLERLTGSAAIATTGALVYMTNPNFLFWSAEFSYESLALPLAVLALAATARAYPGALMPGKANLTEARARGGWSVVACLATAATVATHHLTSYALCVALIAVCIVASSKRSNRREAPWPLAAFAIATTVAWSVAVAPGTARYLFPVLGRAFHQMVATALGHAGGRQLFGGGSSGQPIAPEWQRVIALVSVALIVSALPFGLRTVRRRYASNPYVVMLAAGALGYIAVLPMRLVPAAWETSNRSSEFLFLGVAVVLALVRLPSRVRRAYPVALAAFLGITLIGGVVAGWPPRVLLALPVRSSVAGGGTIEPEPQQVARVFLGAFGPDHRIVAPEAIGRELLVNGRQTAYVSSAPFAAATLLFEDTMTLGMIQTVNGHSLDYVAEDRLASGDDSMAGYFLRDPDHGRRIDPLALAKFDSYPGVERVLDSGDIVIYDVRALRVAP